jgi:hypothetical protein
MTPEQKVALPLPLTLTSAQNHAVISCAPHPSTIAPLTETGTRLELKLLGVVIPFHVIALIGRASQ